MNEKVDLVLPKRIELKQADWPLSSENSPQNTKLDILAHSKEITLIIEKGTKRSTHILNHSLVEKNIKHYSSEKHVCDTCKEEITDISRVLIMRDIDGGPRLLCFHYFFPCWDMQLLCQQYPNLVIDKTAFSIPENMSIKENFIKDMQNNIDLWV